LNDPTFDWVMGREMFNGIEPSLETMENTLKNYESFSHIQRQFSILLAHTREKIHLYPELRKRWEEKIDTISDTIRSLFW
jgi:hypothetical protein